MILVDTSVWIDFFNGHESVEATYLRTCIVDGQSLRIPGLVLAEILVGLRTDAEVKRVTEALSAFDKAPEIDGVDYVKAAELYRACRGRGHTIRSLVDCLLAQLCLRHDYELLAKDRDFVAIGEVSPLRRIGTRLMVHDRPCTESL